MDLSCYKRRHSSVVTVGTTAIGGDNPIRIQSMTTTNTNDTEASVAQAPTWPTWLRDMPRR